MMKEKKMNDLHLGSNVVELLIPHRRPFLMVDCVEAFEHEPEPRITASRVISANEEVFKGHFPGLHLWPGVYTIEGLGQSCNLLYIILCMLRAYEGDPRDVLNALHNLDLGFRMHPGFKPDRTQRIIQGISKASASIGVSTSVDIKLLSPVFAGQRLEYRVHLTHEFEDKLRFDAEALADGASAARGILTATAGIRFPRFL